MFNSIDLFPQYKNLIGWRQHFDNSIVINTALTQTETGEYYQQKHPALSLDIIQTLIPSTYDLNNYLENTIKDSMNEMFNDLFQYRQLNEYGKTLLEQSVLLNKYGWVNDTITNQGRFVGFQIRVKTLSGLKAIIKEVGLQFASDETLNLYLFHSSKLDPIHTFEVQSTNSPGWTWKSTDIDLKSFKIENYSGGVFVLGYYQDDLASNAINYSNFNWDTGVCGGCNDPHLSVWKSIQNHFHVYPIYVASGNYEKEKMFDMEKVFYSSNQSFGLNLKFSVICDLTDFFIQNKFAFKNLLGIKVTEKILNMMKFSQQINAIEENIKMMIIRDLEGDVDTKLTNIPTQYQKELKAVSFNISGINSVCLGCKEDSFAPTYGVV